MTGRSRNADDLRVEIQELFADRWQVPLFSGRRYRFQPMCDVFRTDDPPAWHVVLEVPGVDPSAVRVAVTDGALLVAGVRERPKSPGARYRQMEIEYGTFERRVELGESVDADRVRASSEQGMLRIVLPLVREQGG